MPTVNKKQRAAQTTNLKAASGKWQTCLLTWYDPALGGINSGTGAANPRSPTASGEPYDASAMTCAAPPSYAFGTLLTFRVGTNVVTCRVNDRGGAIQGSHFDLSRAAANALGIIGAGRANGLFMVGGSSGSPPAAPANNTDTSGGGGGGTQISSVLDLLTAPVDTIGGWLASIALNLLKDAGEGVVDYIVRPAWHWNQRAAVQYQTSMFSDKSGKQVLWTAAFWGGGYWLLFTDPNAKTLSPASVRNSRLARHARFAQSLPARQSIVKPKDVRKKTPKKPKPVPSKAVVTQTGTMSTTRTHRVKVTGEHARFATGDGTESTTSIERENANASPNRNTTRPKPTVPHPEHRTGTRSLPHSGGSSQGNANPRGGERNRT